MKKIRELCIKYREILVYLIVGVMTTIFCWVLERFIFDASKPIQNFLINTIDWVAGVLFAFPLNRKWVFKSKNPAILKEFFGFSASRLTTWALDVIIMWLFVNIWPFTNWLKGIVNHFEIYPDSDTMDSINFWFVKIFISSVLVMVANYVFSKLLIFKKGAKMNEDEKKAL